LVTVRIEESSAASQADGPPLSNMEMSFDGRTFPELGRKILSGSCTPLGKQDVSKTDSVLGPLSKHPSKGIKKKYAALVKDAFQPMWWHLPGFVIDVATGTPVIKGQSTPQAPGQYTPMEYNFSLYFGLAIQEYEKLLIADESRFDKFMEGDDSALSPDEQQG